MGKHQKVDDARPKRGRPSVHNKQIIKTVLLNNEKNITTNGKVISKNCSKWTEIAQEITKESGQFISPGALYTIAKKNRYGVFDPPGKHTSTPKKAQNVDDGSAKETSFAEKSDASTVLNDSSICADTITVDIPFSKSELENLIICKQYSRSEKTRRHIPFRKYFVLEPGRWQRIITEKLWDEEKITCGYQFKRNKIYNSTVEVTGKCACGSVINGKIQDYSPEMSVNVMRCEMTKGSSICKKRPLRNPEREEIGRILCERNMAAEIYRTERARELMSIGDAEPPHLYAAKTLRAAKKEYIESQCFDANPIVSLEYAQQASNYKDSIHSIGLSPFYVHYWTNYQLNLYRQYFMKENSSLAIDATGTVVRKITKPSKTVSKHIYLYLIVMNSPEHEKISLAQMLTESQTTNSIKHFLAEWIRTGAPIPREVTCDSSIALLSALVQTFTTCKTIDSYAESCWGEPNQSCYIRIDVAHFIKGYANFLSSQNRRVKEFYLACLGQLILATSLYQAGEISSSIIAIAKSETEGNLSNGEPTLCEEHKIKMKMILTAMPPEDDDNQILEEKKTLDLEVPSGKNSWQLWAENIHDTVTQQIDDTGNRENAHYFPGLVNRILRDVKWYPLWSCICVEKFGYGRKPASSAAVEANNKIIKTQLFSPQNLPTRADLFVMKHLDYIDGRVIMAKAKDIAKDEIADKENCPAVEQNLVRIVEKTENTVEENQEDEIVIRNETEVEINLEKEKFASGACETECPVCKNGDLPSGAHSCAVCKKHVHALDICSTPLQGEEEGHGQKRICASCQNMPLDAIKSIVECGEKENWRGLTTEPIKKKSRYLHRDYSKNLLLLETKLSKVPLLKNGSAGLRSINIGGKKVSLIKTCAFDSIFQIFLVAALDSSEFKNAMNENIENGRIFRSLLDTLKNGITRSTYATRAAILTSLVRGKVDPFNCMVYDCEMTMHEICKHLFQDSCSLQETTICDASCSPRMKPFELIQLRKADILKKDFSTAVEENFKMSESKLCSSNCPGTATTKITYVGPFLIFEVYDFLNKTPDFELHKIPTKIKMSFMANEYSLKGLVHYIPSAAKRRSKDADTQIVTNDGHFTGIARRKDGSWVEFNDLRLEESKLPDKFKANIHILVYGI